MRFLYSHFCNCCYTFLSLVLYNLSFSPPLPSSLILSLHEFINSWNPSCTHVWSSNSWLGFLTAGLTTKAWLYPLVVWQLLPCTVFCFFFISPCYAAKFLTLFGFPSRAIFLHVVSLCERSYFFYSVDSVLFRAAGGTVCNLHMDLPCGLRFCVVFNGQKWTLVSVSLFSFNVCLGSFCVCIVSVLVLFPLTLF